MKTLLIRFALWILARYGYTYGLPQYLVNRAAEVCAEMERRFGPGFGDAKRRDAYALLIKEFPLSSKKDIAFAIEVALRRAR